MLWSSYDSEEDIFATSVDYFLRVTKAGALSLYNVAKPDSLYWSMDLGVDPKVGCFCVALDEQSYQPVASACRTSSIDRDSLEPVLSGGPSLDSWIPNGSKRVLQHGECEFGISDRGSIYMKKDGENMWRTGAVMSKPGQFVLNLSQRGNLVVYEGTNHNVGSPVFATHTKGPLGPYTLAVDKNCLLGIFEGEGYPIAGKLVWSNIRNALMIGQRLGKSEILRQKHLGVFLTVRPDGNLVVYDGNDYSDSKMKKMWSSKKRPIHDNADFFLRAGKAGELALNRVGGGTYWSETFETDETACYAVLIDGDGYHPFIGEP